MCVDYSAPEDPPKEPLKDPCEGDPATAPAMEGCGVFVSTEGDDAAAGTRTKPMRTLQAAIRKAKSGGTQRVFACKGTFHEAVALPSGVDLWGGRNDCEGGAWSWTGRNNLTVIAPKADEVPLEVRPETGSGASVVFGVKLKAQDAESA